MIQECVDDIVKLKCSSSLYIDNLFSTLYAKSIIKMLLKLGMEEEDYYIFDAKKKRLRGIAAKTQGIYYLIHSTKKEGFEELSFIEYNGKYYELWENFYSGDFFNTGSLQLCDMSHWESLYNYIRIDYNSKDKSKIVIKKH